MRRPLSTPMSRADRKEALREPTQQERASMWLFSDRYAAQSGGAIEFYQKLSTSEKRVVQDMLDDLWPKKRKKGQCG